MTLPPSDPLKLGTLIDLLDWRASHQAKRLAYSFLADGEPEAKKVTYVELARRAREIGALLQSMEANGERVLLLYPPGLEYIAAFLGCLYAGAIAVPAYPPRLRKPAMKLQRLVADAQASVALTTTQIAANSESRFAHTPGLASLRWQTTDDLTSQTGSSWQRSSPSGEALALLQYTSGSTAKPKGVMVTHANLMHNLTMMQRAFDLEPDDGLVSWLPPYHDMGLIGAILAPLFVGFPATLMAPTAFLQRPLRWLEAITRTQATVSGGPNFAYDLCVRMTTPEHRAQLDLSRWRVAVNGAEPVYAETLTRFAAAFAVSGFQLEAFHPSYGLAESTLFVSSAAKVIPSESTVSCGRIGTGDKVKIVDPKTQSECQEGQVGEIWLSGPHIARGYWNRPEETAFVFEAAIADTEEGPFLRTGDLGYLQAGELFISGRLKDLIIIRGRNFYPQDIELTVARSHLALNPGGGAAFSVAVNGAERLVIVHELGRHYRQWSQVEILAAMRQAVAQEHELHAHAVLMLKTGSIPKTSSGKIQRHLCRERFLAGSLQVISPWSPNSEKVAVSPKVKEQPNTTRLDNVEPIAIIGIGCRFPGAENPAAFWQLLCEGTDAITEVPAGRWDMEAFYDPNPLTTGKMNTRWGGFLPNIDHFDASFFGISPREAVRMDPQQRLLLEVAWEALEDAGQPLEQLESSSTAVFIGLSSNDYGGLQIKPEQSDLYVGTGNASSIAANRLSYLLNLHGTSMTIDTACSSALVAVHLACCSLWNGEAPMALVGGANAILLPTITVNFTKAGMMSPDGRCKAFDASANGYVRSEGAGVVVLKPLSQAVKAGDPVYAVIRGSAVNQDGRSHGLTVPNIKAQTGVILEACRRAGISPHQIDYVEAHGTGTPLGDPIEAQALGQALAIGRQPGQPCAIGSVKTNIGHLEAASGIAGLIKVALALKHRQIPPSLHFHDPNPNIPFDKLPIQIQQTLDSWPTQHTAFAGVNSFGFGGTNAHVVLAEAPPTPAGPEKAADNQPCLLPLSARSQAALRALAQTTLDDMAGETALPDLCYSASVRRTHHDHRLALVGHSRQEFTHWLQAFLEGERRPGLRVGQKRPERKAKLVFVFSGQGSQWPGMGQELLTQEPLFRATLEKCDEAFRRYVDWSLIQELLAAEPQSRLEETEVAQPVLFAFQIALAALWRSWGIVPDAMVGHSVGEVAAAHIAGALSLEDATSVIFHRSRLMQQMTGLGQMAVVPLSEAAAAQAIAGREERLAIAAINSPNSTVLSGDPDELAIQLQSLEQRGVVGHLLPVNYAFHSHQMDPILDELVSSLKDIKPHPAAIPIFSTVTGQPGADFDADYWAQNLRNPVRFMPVITQLADQEHDIFLEISPQPVLASMVVQCVQDENVKMLPSLRRRQGEKTALLNALGALYAHGYPVKWSCLYPKGGNFVNLPSYPWQHERYWLASMAGDGWQNDKQHPLLGQRLNSGHPIWQNQLGRHSLPYLDDHRIHGGPLLPGTAYIEMILAASAEHFAAGPRMITAVEIAAALSLPEKDTQTTVQLVLAPAEAGESTVHIYSQSPSAWTLHATATIHSHSAGIMPDQDQPAAIQTRCSETISGREFYQELQGKGFEYGPSFRGITRLWRSETEALGLVQIPSQLEKDLENYQFHPAVMDACGQVLLAIAGSVGETFVPISAGRVQVFGQPSSSMWSYARLRPYAESDADVVEGDGCLYAEDGSLLILVEGLRLRRLDYGSPIIPQDVNEWLYDLQWHVEARTLSSPPASSGNWLIFADDGNVAPDLVKYLMTQGERCILVTPGEAYKQLEADHFIICPTHRKDLIQLIATAAQPACRGVIHLWGLNSPSLEQAQALGCISILHLVQALAEAGPTTVPRLWLVTQNVFAIETAETIAPASASLWGLGRTIAFEHPELNCTMVDLGNPDETQSLCDEIWLGNSGSENQISLRSKRRYVARLARYELTDTDENASRLENHLTLPSTPYRLHIATPGRPDNLTLRTTRRRPPGPGEIEIRVQAAGLNFRDVMKVMGVYPSTIDDVQWLGDECAGQVVAVGKGVEAFAVGDEVIVIAPMSFATFVTTPAVFAVPKPPNLSFEEAATIPIAFLTAYYALHHLGQLKAGERVLIHAASGGVGLAAVQVAKWLGAEIFATAGKPEKRDFLRSLGIEHVMDSRSLTFADEIMTVTNGSGVDVVLNSLAGEALGRSLATLGAYGRFLEIGKRDIYQNSRLGLRPFRNNLAFFSIDLGQLFQDRPHIAGELLREVMQHLANGNFDLLPHQVYPISEAVGAFSIMARAKHIGKIAISLLPDEQPEPSGAALFRSDSTYLITGGLGALGLLVAQWMVQQGARHLVLLGRSGAVRPAAAETIAQMQMIGTHVEVIKGDVAQKDQLAAVLATMAATWPTLRGIIHAAGTMDNDLLLHLNQARFQTVMAPKIAGAWNLHTLTLADKLDFFVLFSSSASLLGSPRQGNYAAANAFLDALARYRQRQGLPALSLNWWAWVDLGMATHFDRDRRLAHRGLGSIPLEQGLELLERLMRHSLAGHGPTEVGVMPVIWQRWREFYPAVGGFPLFTTFMQELEAEGVGKNGGAGRSELLALPPDERRQWIGTYILKEIAQVMQIEISQLDVQQPLNTLGMDSLMGIELKARVESDLCIIFPVSVLIQGPSIDQVTEELLTLVTRSLPPES